MGIRYPGRRHVCVYLCTWPARQCHCNRREDGEAGAQSRQVGKCAGDEILVLLLVFFQCSTKQGLQLQVRLGEKG